LINNLIISDRNKNIDKLTKKLVIVLERVIKKRINISNIQLWVKIKKIQNIKNLLFEQNNNKIFFLDQFHLIKYYLSISEYKERYINLLKKFRKVFDYLELEAKNYENKYKDLNMYDVYENNLLITSIWKYIDLYLSLEILLEKFEIKNLYIPKHLLLILKILELRRGDKKILLHQYNTSNILSLSKKFIAKKNPFFKMFEYIKIKSKEKGLKEKHKQNQPNHKNITKKNEPKVGFYYYGSTHKRVGESLFNFLKNREFNVIEINPLYFKHTRFLRGKINHKRIMFSFKKLYQYSIRKFKDPLIVLFLWDNLNIISTQLKEDLNEIRLVFKILKRSKIDLLTIFNENSFLGKIAALICKQLNIPTLYIPHGALGENYIFVFPRWCDIMILNTDIERDFLLNGKLNPDLYSNRLKVLGNTYFDNKHVKKLSVIKDELNKNETRKLSDYNYKITLGLAEGPIFMNHIIINQVLKLLKSQKNFIDYLLIVKLHPADDLKNYRDFFSKSNEFSVIIVKNLDIRRIITSSNIYLTTPSTTVLQAILLKTPTIVLNYYYDYRGTELYNDERHIIFVKNYEELKVRFQRLLFDKEFREENINKSYNHGIKFCKDYDVDNYEEKINFQLLEIIQNLIKGKNLKS